MVWQYGPGLLAIDMGRMWWRKSENTSVDYIASKLHIIEGDLPANDVERALLLEQARMRHEMWLRQSTVDGVVDVVWEP